MANGDGRASSSGGRRNDLEQDVPFFLCAASCETGESRRAFCQLTSRVYQIKRGRSFDSGGKIKKKKTKTTTSRWEALQQYIARAAIWWSKKIKQESRTRRNGPAVSFRVFFFFFPRFWWIKKIKWKDNERRRRGTVPMDYIKHHHWQRGYLLCRGKRKNWTGTMTEHSTRRQSS